MGTQPLERASKATRAGDGFVQVMPVGQEASSARKRVLVVGASAFGRRIAAKLRSSDESDRTVIGFIDSTLTGPWILGTPEELATVARRTFADEVIFAGMPLTPALRDTIAEVRHEHVDVIAVPEPIDDGAGEPQFGILAGLPVLILRRTDSKPINRLIKRLIDIVGSFIGLLLLLPLFLVVAVIIKLDSAGPIMYPHTRVGFRGRPFICWKFRTMIPRANSMKHQLWHLNELGKGFFFKIKDDPRLTRIGRLLRRYSIDELPQLWNVLCGDMSLVGPRPSPIDEYARYSTDHFARLRVKPGITGLWQIVGRRDPDFERAMRVDHEYVNRWNILLDLKILLKTIGVLAQGE